jgi:hypothetical protein
VLQKRKIVSVLAILSLLCVAVIPVQYVKASPVVYMQDGFESDQDFHLWSWTIASPSCTLETTNVNPHLGSWAAHSITQQYGDVAYVATDFNGYGPAYSVDPLYVRAYFYIDQLNLPSDQTWIDLVDIVGGPTGASSGNYSTSVRIENNLGTINWALATVENNLTTWTYGTHTVQTGQYYSIETLRDVTHGVEMLWINGQLEVSTTTAMTHPSWEVKVGIPWEGRSASQTMGTCEVHYDDVIISNQRIPQTSIFNATIGGNVYPVSILSNSSISNFSFNQSQKAIKFNVSGESGTGFCNVTFPTQLLGAPYVELIDGSQQSGTVTSNATHNSVYFTYSQSSHSVDVVGTVVAPEFPTIIANMLVLSAMALMLLFAKRRLMQGIPQKMAPSS